MARGILHLFQLIAIIFVLPELITGQLLDNHCPDERHVIACYYASWGIYRPANGTYKIEFIDPKLCTHLIYSFAGLNLDGMIDSLDTSNDIALGEGSSGMATI